MNGQDLLLTDHCIDDLPDSEVSLELFRLLSKFSHVNCSLSKDGRQLHYRVDAPAKEKYLKMARLTIAMFVMPLQAEIAEDGVTIKYTGK